VSKPKRPQYHDPWETTPSVDEQLEAWVQYADHLEAEIGQFRHDRDVLAENLRDIRDAVWRMGTNAYLQRYNEDRHIKEARDE